MILPPSGCGPAAPVAGGSLSVAEHARHIYRGIGAIRNRAAGISIDGGSRDSGGATPAVSGGCAEALFTSPPLGEVAVKRRVTVSRAAQTT